MLQPLLRRILVLARLRGGDLGAEIRRLDMEGIANEKLRIYSLIPGDEEGSAFIFAKRQIRELQRQGHICETFYFRPSRNVRKMLQARRELARRIEDFSPDLVHANYGTVCAFLGAISTRRPLVVTFRGDDLNWVTGASFFHNLVGKLLSVAAAARSAGIICVSTRLRDRLRLPFLKSRAEIIPNGVDLSLFRPMDRAEARRKLGWGPAKRAVLFNCGRAPAVPCKRLDLAEEAAAGAAAELPGLELVKLHGDIRAEEMPLYMNACDCLLLTSDHEGSPNMVKEAIACGLPVVSVDVGDAAEHLAFVTPSWIVPRHPREISRALVEACSDQRRSNGSDYAATRLDQAKAVDKVIAVYRRALER